MKLYHVLFPTEDGRSQNWNEKLKRELFPLNQTVSLKLKGHDVQKYTPIL